MNKKPEAYVTGGRHVVRSRREPADRDLLEEFYPTSGDCVLDLNRGIKTLWDANEYDAPSVQYRRSRSTLRQIMDEEFTIKRDDPKTYADLIGKPLGTTRLIITQEDPCIRYFVTDPTQGRLTFHVHSLSSDCIDEFSRKIIAAN